MSPTTSLPSPGPADVSLTIAGQTHQVRFGLNVLRDWGKLAQRSASEFGLAIVEDHLEAFASIIVCAVRRSVPAQAVFTQDQATDLLEEMSQSEADALARVILTMTTNPNPLLTALNKQAEAKRQDLPSTPAANAVESTPPQPESTH